MKNIYLIAPLLLLIVGLTSRVEANQTAPSTARFRITFNANWSNATHPHPNFPSNDHWSALVGAMHNDSIHLWEVGGFATPGIKSVAEFGANGTLNGEVNDAIADGTADQWIARGMSPYSGVASATVEIDASSDFPLLSLATMVAPSPDWFTGVDSLPLFDSTDGWIDAATVNVYPHDAGTDSGVDYGSLNQVTVPFAPIADYTGVAPFSAEPIGTLTAERISTPTAIALQASHAASASPSQVVLFLIGLLAVTSGHLFVRRFGIAR